MNTYIKHSEDTSLTHFGIKGMKWKKGRKTPEQKPMSFADRIRAQYEQEQSRIAAEKEAQKAKEAKEAKKAATAKRVKKAKSLGKKKLRQYAKAAIRGNYGNGRARVKALRKRRVSYKDAIRIQGMVNEQYGINSGASQDYINSVYEEYGVNRKKSKKRQA